MHKIRIQIIALCLTVVLLTGCGSDDFLDTLKKYEYYEPVAYKDMKYVRPDMDEIENILAESCSIVQSGESFSEALDAIYDFYDIYDRFHTNYNLAYIHYNGDLTDGYWEEEFNFCAKNVSAIENGLEELYYAAAKSP